jgi:2-C-methyl-D-erythritol 4-phosphate cytidylyltransferase
MTSSSKKIYAVIVAGGRGKRMGTEIPKQFLELAGKPVLMHTIERFIEFDSSIEIITVLPDNQLRYWVDLQKKYFFTIPHTLVKGGANRFFSVRNGLEFISGSGLVAIHDGVRPLVTVDTIKRCFDGAIKYGNAIPVIPVSDSLRLISGDGSKPFDRTLVKLVQTPQVFDINLIKNAYLQNYDPEFTDDASVLEKAGESIRLVEGNLENVKITTPWDLTLASSYISLSH